MPTIQELKKELKKAQAEIYEKKKINELSKSISKEDIKTLQSSEDVCGSGHSEKIRFTLEIDMEVTASPENEYDTADLHHVDLKLVSSSGIPNNLAKEMVDSLEYMQHDDSDFSWAKNLSQAKTVIKVAQKKINDHAKVLDEMAKKYDTNSAALTEALWLTRCRAGVCAAANRD